MTGQPSTILFAFSFFIFFLYAAKRMYTLPSIVKQRVEVEIIMKKDVIHGQNQIKNALNFYFRSLFMSLAVVLLCVFASAVNFLFMLLTTKTGGTPSPLWQVVLAVFVLFLSTFLVTGLKILDTKVLRGEIMSRFIDQ